ELLVGYAVRCDAPLQCLAAGNAPRAHHDILRARDTDDLLQTRRSAGAGDLAELLLGQRVKEGLRDNAEVPGTRYLETDAQGVAGVSGDDRLAAARRRGNVPGQLGDMLGRGFEESANEAAGRKVLADRAQHDNADAWILV